MSWEEVWRKAQPRLTGIKEALSSFTSPSARVIRVGQLDSELLDLELANLLQEPLRKALSLVNASLQRRFDPEVHLLIQLTLYRLSIWNMGASYGAKLQGLRYVAPSSPGKKLAPSGLSRRLLLMHGTLTIIIPYLHARIRSHGLSRAWPDAPSSDRRRKAWELLVSLESTYALLGLASFVAFLWNGNYRTIADRLFNMRLVPARRLVQRDVSYEFMNRQMVWHAFTEFLLFFLPLINPRKIQRRIHRLTTSVLSSLTSSSRPSSTIKARGKYWSFPENECAICAENASYSLNITEATNAFTNTAQMQIFSAGSGGENDAEAEAVPKYPIHTPYITSCGHVYCYHCIAERMMRSADEATDVQGWECLRCAQVVRSAERYAVDPAGGATGSEASGSEYDFSSDMDFDVTDISGSVGSYSESGQSDDY